MVVLTVMYGSESWGMKVIERQKLNVFEMKMSEEYDWYLGWVGLGIK